MKTCYVSRTRGWQKRWPIIGVYSDGLSFRHCVIAVAAGKDVTSPSVRYDRLTGETLPLDAEIAINAADGRCAGFFLRTPMPDERIDAIQTVADKLGVKLVVLP